MISEFEIIARYFSRAAPSAVLGVGDDCALVQPRADRMLAVSTDMLLEGRHFAAGADPAKLGHKALAVNLSDLAAMGADPRWALLAIALPAADQAWLGAFATGFHAIASEFEVDLIGGDTTRGPLCITVTVIGELPQGLALRRDGARAGDEVWISGATGEAALALAHREGRIALAPEDLKACAARLDTPQPRVELGGRLRGVATSAIDVSDGLLADLGHVLAASGVGAAIRFDDIPRAAAISGCPDAELAKSCLVAGGDDYELLFTAPAAQRAEVDAIGADLGLALRRIGTIVPGAPRAALRDSRGAAVPVASGGFDHFR